VGFLFLKIFIYVKKIKEQNYVQVRQGGDERTGHGYATLKTKMPALPSADGFPYRIHNKETTEEEDIENLEMAFGNKKSLDRAAAKSNIVRNPSDSYPKRDLSSFFDDQTIGLRGEGHLRNYCRNIFEDIFRLRSRSSEPDGAVNQFGMRVPGGTQFGWSSAYPFKDKDSYKPHTSLRDLLLPDEEKTPLDKLDDDWKEEIAQDNWEKEQYLDLNKPFRVGK